MPVVCVCAYRPDFTQTWLGIRVLSVCFAQFGVTLCVPFVFPLISLLSQPRHEQEEDKRQRRQDVFDLAQVSPASLSVHLSGHIARAFARLIAMAQRFHSWQTHTDTHTHVCLPISQCTPAYTIASTHTQHTLAQLIHLFFFFNEKIYCSLCPFVGLLSSRWCRCFSRGVSQSAGPLTDQLASAHIVHCIDASFQLHSSRLPPTAPTVHSQYGALLIWRWTECHSSLGYSPFL